MKRIGIAASRMSKGNLLFYNFYVVLISLLFSSFIFIISGSVIVFGLMLLYYFASEIMQVDMESNIIAVQYICMVTLTVIVVLFNLFAILTNIKFTGLPKDSEKS